MSKRRANGEGNIRKRADGRWEGRYTAGYDAQTGRRIIRNVLGRTQAEAKEKLAKAIESTKALDVSRTDEYTVQSWLRTWYALYSKPNIRPSTAEYYERIIETYTIPRIGSIKLNKLTGRDIQKLYRSLQTSGRERKEQKEKQPGLSNTTVRGVHMVLHNALERARKEKLILTNPTDDCIIPKLEKKEMKILKPEDMRAYLKAAEDYGVLPMFYLELTSGIRKGELVALLWEDVDVKERTVSVSKQASRGPGGLIVVGQPKTENSVRMISIPQETVDMLVKEHEKHPDNPYLFPSSRTGGMYYPDTVVNLHRKMLKKAGLPHIRFHDLRHTFATMALQNGVDVRTVCSMLGHYDPGFTLRTYTHATRQKQNEAAQKLGDFMMKVI